jgi:hypothetical protein
MVGTPREIAVVPRAAFLIKDLLSFFISMILKVYM